MKTLPTVVSHERGTPVSLDWGRFGARGVARGGGLPAAPAGDGVRGVDRDVKAVHGVGVHALELRPENKRMAVKMRQSRTRCCCTRPPAEN